MSQSLYHWLTERQDAVTPPEARFSEAAHGTHVVPEAWDHVAIHLRTLAADMSHEPPTIVRQHLLDYLAALDQASLAWRHELTNVDRSTS